jgi:hypothetical protein
MERVKLFVFRYFERMLTLLLVAAMLGIHYAVEQKFAFLSFYYLPVILAGFYGGRRFAIASACFVTLLVFFIQGVQGLGVGEGFTLEALTTLVPWAGFLIITGYVVGGLAEQRAERMQDVKNAYLATLELLTFHIEAAERHQQGHSKRVSDLAVALAKQLDLPAETVEDLRIAALLHEVGTKDARLLRLLSRSVSDAAVPIGRAMRGAAEIISEYGHYYEIVGEEWDVDALPLPPAVKVLAVADAFETLQIATPVRRAFPKWSALEEIEKGAGRSFARDVVKALRAVSSTPERADAAPVEAA